VQEQKLEVKTSCPQALAVKKRVQPTSIDGGRNCVTQQHTYVVLFPTNSVVVKHSEIIHSHDVALIRSLVQPLDGLGRVLLNAHAVRVHQAKVA
jgi:hypothetical protein